MEYSSDKVMTRKEYLKTKRKGKLGIRIVKYGLLIIVIALLSVYLFKQLDVYNNVTKMANKVVEETALAKTMTMYYVADGYTKDAAQEVMLYKAYDSSRTKISGTVGFSNINVYNGVLYGLAAGKLYSINLETNEKMQISDKTIKDYNINSDKIYCYIEAKNAKETGIYLYNNEDNSLKLIINIAINQFLVDDNYIFAITKGKTEKSIVRYNLNGSGRTVITDKEIATYMKQDKNNIYYIAGDQLYSIKKNGKANTLITDDKIYRDANLKENITTISPFEFRGDTVYYIIKADEKHLCALNIKTGNKQILSKKNIESIQLKDNTLYYKINGGLEIHKINLENGKTEQVTGIRGTEYICIN